MNRYHYTSCGLDNIYLENGFSIENTPYGEAIAIQDIEGLHKAISRTLLWNPNRLSGKEFRFLRNQMYISQKHLAGCLGISDQTVARIEKEETRPDIIYECFFRLLAFETILNDRAEVKALLDELNREEDERCKEEIILSKKNKGQWSKAA